MLIPVILSGGAGTRLWPVSREGHPKPFMKLADGESLLGKTYRRAAALHDKNGGKPKTILTVTHRDYYFMSRDELDQRDLNGEFLLEPFSRNTAAAIALAARYAIALHEPEAVLLILPADHLILDQAAFAQAVVQAGRLAQQGYMVTFGIKPNAPETGFGYIECGQLLGGEGAGYDVARFVEKPDLETAKGYVDSGRYLWNSGMFAFQAATFLQELSRHAPEVSLSVEQCWNHLASSAKDASFIEIPADIFAHVPDISVDYAVFEKSERVAVVPGDFGWSDIGSWNAVRDLLSPDENNNRSCGDVVLIDSSNTYVQSDGRLVAALGLDNVMVIDTPDALLVAHQDKAQDVKKVVAQIKKTNHEAYRLHRTVVRPWGSYTVLEEGPHHKIKRIEVKPGASLSLQLHHHRSEHWVVVSGMAKITCDGRETLIQANESSYIHAGQQHRLENPGILPCTMIEVQCGEYLGEDDIVRFDDKYGRSTGAL
ncbi:mannose-1-phosphate guanylyltransferase/mannose-6-phosphate isomerase [Candidatus Methylospira mobilis]|uniref:mannose-1-phosphate guanylyltransferase n=1 Tax=Candidatus Methylospira mobilis TaxID=1808979 RepID=A0A5Q0BS92_9GAMM|nr:mannose-1-phosphate guanylyltransferase/mannose-6-phosphate isomerase [Candidatus Methylospira mobilis]QFY44937.1 mannose-1-phosphate guanylyltransferase/mannose-6-phosphate isomerase [Candidatus Methylospira mobilis]WNV06832.1 mannose-1-phosphate guanylyltransferase/mannose-6-phosphate isomerase [Candidatus Methylospira mobilis]